MPVYDEWHPVIRTGKYCLTKERRTIRFTNVIARGERQGRRQLAEKPQERAGGSLSLSPQKRGCGNTNAIMKRYRLFVK